MKRVIAILISLAMLLTLCGCAKVIEEYPIDARYTESYKGIDTTYEMKWNGDTWSEMPNTHTVVFPDKYEIQYRINYSDGSSETKWKEVARDEYEMIVEKYDLGKGDTE